MASKLSQRVCLKPGLLKIAVSETADAHGRRHWQDVRTKKFLCGHLEGATTFGHQPAVLVRSRGKLYAGSLKQLRELKQFARFKP